jgi:hypothetical protein
MDKITNEELVKLLIDEDNAPLTPLGELRKAELLSRLARVSELEKKLAQTESALAYYQKGKIEKISELEMEGKIWN